MSIMRRVRSLLSMKKLPLGEEQVAAAGAGKGAFRIHLTHAGPLADWGRRTTQSKPAEEPGDGTDLLR
jgi:hypothetical protein